jgi:hypothetical protein
MKPAILIVDDDPQVLRAVEMDLGVRDCGFFSIFL